MDAKIEQRKTFLINFAYGAIIVLLYYYFVKYALWYIFPFLFAALIAAALQRPIRFLGKKLKTKKKAAISGALVMVICLLIGMLLVLVGIFIAGEIEGFASYLSGELTHLPEYVEDVKTWLLNMTNRLPLSMRTSLYQSIMEFFNENLSFDEANAGSVGASFDFSLLLAPLTGVWSTAKRIPSVMLAILVTIISCFFMAIGYTNIRDMTLGFFSKEKQTRIVAVKRSFFGALTKMTRAYCLLMFITFTEMMLGLNLLKLFGFYEGGYIFVIALATAVVDIIPVLGTGAVLIPWAVVCLVLGNYGLGIGLLVMYAAISVLRQIIEPKLVAGQVGLPAIVTFMAMFVGAKIFGVFGIIILPLTVITLKLMHDEGVFASNNSKEKE